MGVSKVIYNGKNLIDLTGDTVSPETLAKGITAHDMAGNKITGTLTAKSDLIDVSKLPTTVDDRKIYRVKGDRSAIGYIFDVNGNVFTIQTAIILALELNVAVNYVLVDSLPTTGITITETVWTAYIVTTTNVGYFYIEDVWVDFATLANIVTGETYQNKGAVGSPSEITEKGCYIVYTEQTTIGIPNENRDKKATFWNGSSWGAGGNKVVELDGENLPDVGEEGTIYFRNNVPCAVYELNGKYIPYIEAVMLIFGQTRVCEKGIICENLPPVGSTYDDTLTVRTYYVKAGSTYTFYVYMDNKFQAYDTPIQFINEIWYYREGRYVKISKFGWTDSDLKDVDGYLPPYIYVGDTYSVNVPFTKNQAIAFGISGEIPSQYFALDGFWNDFRRVRVGALAGCTEVTKVDNFDVNNSYGDNVIGAAAFYGCTGLTELNIEAEGGIEAHAFYGCTNLKTVYVYCDNSDSLSEWYYVHIGEYAFANCTSLLSIHFNGTKSQWNSGTFGRGWNENTGDYTIYCTDGNIAKS